MATLNLIKRTGLRSKRRLGRGQSSGAGKTSGKGTKGQNSRSGRKKRPEIRDIIKKIPKRRGFGKNRARTVNASRRDAVALSLERLETLFPQGGEVSPKVLYEKGLINRTLPPIKIVGGGNVTKKFTISRCGVSATARTAIEKAGGTITLK